MSDRGGLLLPNLGAEEGDDWRGYRKEPAIRVAAELWGHLFSDTAKLRIPAAPGSAAGRAWIDQPLHAFWPTALGERPSEAVYPWLSASGRHVPWLRNATIGVALDAETGTQLEGPEAAIVAHVHDKAFAVEAARTLELLPSSLAGLFSVFEPDELSEPERAIERLQRQLARWPEGFGGRFTLKPRFGSSGRGRVGGTREVDTAALRGALPRLAERGGAIFEPWFERRCDLSVCLQLAAATSLPTLLGSLEMLSTPSGGFRGHCGEFDARGRVFSGHREDETLRAQAAAVSTLAGRSGFFGVCGVDAFTYSDPGAPNDGERLRPAVEFNARPTMGLVALGLLRRALARAPDAIRPAPGERHAFLLVLLAGDAAKQARELATAASMLTDPICLASPDASDPKTGSPSPYLFFARGLAPLRAAYRRALGC